VSDIESDMAAAKLSGKEPHKLYDSAGLEWIGIGESKPYVPFTLSAPSTRDAVVQVLGEKYRCSIVWIDGNDGYGWFYMFADRESNGVGYIDYEAAIRAAVIEVMK